jgi:hypothetical protein
MNLPARSFGGWVTAPRITKDATFDVSGLPSEATDITWTSMWGMNRPSTGRSHPILSEVEAVVQHESRSGLVVLRVTGDSESEVDGFIATIRRDFERTYQQQDDLSRSMTHSHFHSSSDQPETSFYWRQKYLWLLGSGFIASTLITAFLARPKKLDPNKPAHTTAGNAPI